MNTEDTVEYNSLRWVKKELDLILHEALASLSAYVEDNGDSDRLSECIEHLHMVHGTLQMVELYGAAQLAEEMEYVAIALKKGELEKTDDAYDVLMRAMLQLPDYLESLQAGNKDVPMVLLPLLNDLRTARNASLLSENVLFFPDIDSGESATEETVTPQISGQLLTQARKLRPHYQVGLLGWLKGQKAQASLKRVQAVLVELEKNSSDIAIRRLWSIGAALTEGLLNNAIDSNASIKMLLGKIDRNIKQLIELGESAYAKKIPTDLLKNLLYYIARVNKESPRVNQIKQTYHLAELLPGDAELEEARSGLGGLNIELLRTVSQGIREDLLEVKDALEIFVHSEAHDVERLSGTPDLLNKIADTLAMLGLGALREQILGQRGRISKLRTATPGEIENDVMSIAGELLAVEAQLNSFIANRSGDADKAGHQRFAELATLPESEYLDVLNSVIREALQAFSDARQAILSYLENPRDRELLDLVLKRLEEVRGAMFMLPIKRLEPQLQSLVDYVANVLIVTGKVPDRNTQDTLADVVTSIEYYLEAVLEGRPDLELSFNTGEQAAQHLNALSAGTSAASAVDVLAPVTDTPVAEMDLLTVEDVPVIEEICLEIPDAEAKTETLPQVIEPEIEPVKPRPNYAILGDDADEEILEIFIEESLEELASLSEQYPLWKSEPGNNDALTTIRRSFHTLKGSGRLIGAQLIGEFAWAFENMLNRVIDKTRPANREVFDALDEALGVLPQLIEQLKGNRDPVPRVYDLIEHAEALSKWRPKTNDLGENKSQVKSVLSAANAHSELPPTTIEEQDEVSLIDPDVLSEEAMHAIDATLESETDIQSLKKTEESLVLEEELVEPEDSQSPDFDLDMTRDLQNLQGALNDDTAVSAFELDTAMSAMDEAALQLNTDEIPLLEEDVAGQPAVAPIDSINDERTLEIHMDPMLFQIFKAESESHLQQIRSLLDQYFQDHKPLIPSPELIRALHTLFGSARTAEVDEIAELCGGLEKYVRKHQELNLGEISNEGVRLIDDVSQCVARVLVALADPGKRISTDESLLKRIAALSEKLVRTVELSNAADGSQSDKETVTQVTRTRETESLVSYSDVDEELVNIFLEEAEELVDGCENSLQRWNNNNSDSESVLDLQRQLHTLKGGARMADLVPIGNLTHSLESLIISVNEGQLAFTREMSHVLHEAMDRLSDMLARVKARKAVPTADRLIAHIEGLRRGEVSTPPSKTLSSDEDEESEPAPEFTNDESAVVSLVDDASFNIEISEDFPASDVHGSDTLPDVSEDEFAAPVLDDEARFNAGEILPEAPDTSLTIEELSAPEPEVVVLIETPEPELVPERESFLIEREQKPVTEEPEEAKTGVAQEQVRVRADLLNALVNNAGEVSVYHARMNQQVAQFTFNLSELDQTISRLREQLRKLSIETEAQILSRYEKESDQYKKHFDPLELDRFSTMQHLSRSLQETVGDMGSIRDILIEGVRDAETLLLQEARVSAELQEGLMRTRMVHLGGLASRLRRIVRQTARELEKDVEMDFIGESNEVDRTVLDRIVAPLEHMLRNAVAHGVELPAVRRSSGKTETGHVTINADRMGGEVIIKVTDDGRGIDAVAVRKRAIERGLLAADSKLSDHDILQFIMQPGFSTAEQVTQIAGRGVGMDVVDREIKQLGGMLEINTVAGKGTTFTIHLPLTLAINHALLVSVGEEIYAVPLNTIEGVVRISGPELQAFYDSGDAHYEFAATRYQLKHLGKLLVGEQPNYSRNSQLFPVLLARVGDQRVALHVDDLLGRREIVVKPVGPQISTIRGISGATILGDGRVVLILEMSSLLLGDVAQRVIEDQIVQQEPQQEVEVASVPKVEEQRVPLVMVVDDSITIRKVTERVLTRHGMRVVTAKDGVDAVAKLQEFMPDVMLLDIEMPRMDGYEVATHVRNDARLKNIPIIMITSRSGAKHREKAMEIGVNKYLGKPYQEDDLMANIKELIG